MNVTFITTRYSTTLPLDTTARWSLIQTPVTSDTLSFTRAMPCFMASSKLFLLPEMISMILATDMR